jgi:hypothetical protein
MWPWNLQPGVAVPPSFLPSYSNIRSAPIVLLSSLIGVSQTPTRSFVNRGIRFKAVSCQRVVVHTSYPNYGWDFHPTTTLSEATIVKRHDLSRQKMVVPTGIEPVLKPYQDSVGPLN